MKRKKRRVLKCLGWFLFLVVILWGFSSVQAQTVGKTAKTNATSLPHWIVDYDVVVIGASLGGLVTATILARNGLKTALVERTDQVGGTLGSGFWHGYWMDYGLRDSEDVMDDWYIFNRKAAYYKKAAEATGVELPLDPTENPNMIVHLRTPDNKVGKTAIFAPSPETWLDVGVKLFDLSPEQVTKFKSAVASLREEDPQKWLHVTLGEWLTATFPSLQDENIRKFFLWCSMTFFTYPPEISSMGRWIKVLKDPPICHRISDAHDLEVGGLQGGVEQYAKAIKKYGGEIKYDLQTEEILMGGNNKLVTGVVVRDKANVVQVLRAPVVVYALPVWKIFRALDESYFPRQFVEDAWKLEEANRGGAMILNLGISRLPTVRATGKPDTFNLKNA